MTKYTYQIKKDGYVIKRGKEEITPTFVVRSMNMKWGRYAKQISPKQNTIILIKQPRKQSGDEFAEALQMLADEILARMGITCFLIGVEEFSDFRHIDEAAMERLGWVRAETVMAYITESFEDINARLKEEEE